MFTHVVLAVDLVCFALDGGRLQVALVERGESPFEGCWALPGGAVRADEPLDAAAGRLLAERLGLPAARFEQLYTFGAPARDPRGRTVAVAYSAVLPTRPALRPGRGVRAAAWWAVEQVPELAFDHDQIVAYARWRLAQKVEYTPLAFLLLPEQFTMGDLRAVHEAIGGRPLDPSNFSRQMLARWDLAPLPGVRDRRTRRPARVFRYIGSREVSGGPRLDEPNRQSGRRAGQDGSADGQPAPA